MKKKFTKRTLLVAALTMSALSLGSVAKADDYQINNLSTLQGFITQETQTTGVLTQDILTGGNIGNVTKSGLTLDGKGYYLDGSNGATPAVATYSGFEIGNTITSFVLQDVTMTNFAKTGSDTISGGAIYNAGTLTINNSTFTGNSVTSTSTTSATIAGFGFGGAIHNAGTITDITGAFTNNSAISTATVPGSAGYGGAIDNVGNITNIYADFTNNSAGADYPYDGGGGAISNTQGGTITNIVSNFTGNYGAGWGAAILNENANITNIGSLTQNQKATFSNNVGGAITNESGAITNIYADFTENSLSNWAYGGAIQNMGSGTINYIAGNFTGNSADIGGGAIGNQATISMIENATFNENYATISDENVYGGAIINEAKYGRTATITTIKYSTFTKNYAKAVGTYVAQGGAINNSASAATYDSALTSTATTGNIAGTFAENYAKSESGDAQGGAIANNAKATAIKANNATATATIGNITGIFAGNYAQSTSGTAKGGAIYNNAEKGNGGGSGTETATATIENINADFTGNYAQSTSGAARGGAIYNATNGVVEPDESGASIALNGVTFTGNYVQAGDSTLDTPVIGTDAKGGAIYNTSDGASITLTGTNAFNYNYATTNTDNSTYGAKGGAIFNYTGATLDITGATTFEGNYTEATGEEPNKGYAYGGAIYNAGSINNIGTADNKATFKYNGIKFVTNGNEIDYELKTQLGGAIYNSYDSTINSINADFDHNAVTGNGGAIYNAPLGSGNPATIKAINGNFVGNRADGFGGAIYNEGIIGYDTTKGGIGTSDNKAIFEGNGYMAYNVGSEPSTTVKTQQGGAIYNNGTITNIYADFDSNAVTYCGGAIISNLDGDSTGTTATISKISGNFTNNFAKDSGGAIYNGANASGKTTTIENITDTVFSGNWASGLGGAIYNSASGGTATINLGNVTFENNYISADGGKTITSYNDIYNYTENGGVATININGNVSMTGGITGNGTTNINSTGTLTLDYAPDGNLATLATNVNFNNGTLNLADGNVTTSTIDNVTGTGYVNLDITKDAAGVHSDKIIASADTAATVIGVKTLNIHNTLDIYDQVGYYEGVTTGKTGAGTFKAGADDKLYQFGYGTDYESQKRYGVFITNAPETKTLAQMVDAGITSYSITDERAASGNSVSFGGGDSATTVNQDLYIYGNGGIIDGGNKAGMEIASGKTFKAENVTFQNFKQTVSNGSAGGGVIKNEATITSLNGTKFENNKVISESNGDAYGGGIANSGVINSINADFENNSAIAQGNSIAQGAAISNNGSGSIATLSGNFSNNIATSESGNAQGGAIYNYANINSITDSTFTGNSVISTSGEAQGGAIYNSGTMSIVNSTFSGNTANGTPNDIHNIGDLTFVGANSLDGGITDATGSPTGRVYVGDGSTKTTVTLGNEASLQQNEVILNHNAMLALGTRAANNFDVDTFTVNGCTLSLQNGSIDSFSFNDLVLNDDLDMMINADLKGLGSIDTVEAINVLGDANINVSNIKLLSDMDSDITGLELEFTQSLKNKVKYTGDKKIAYSALYKYDVSYNSTTGRFLFGRDGGSASLNPAILASSVAAQGMYLTQINTYEEAFANMDQIMLMTKEQRTAWRNKNKYAATEGGGVVSYNPNQFPEENKGVWFRPFASFESVPISNGPKTDNISYGGLVGGDSDLITFKMPILGEVDMTWGAYAGYNGSRQKYQGNSIYQNGGTLGLNSAFYWKDFFLGVTANVGASAADATTMFGREDFAMLATGIAGKFGYNWDLLNGKFIIQPSMLMSASLINTFDYTNAADVQIHSCCPILAGQLVPGIKLIGNLKNGWQPYLNVQMIWNIMNDAAFKADDVHLPDMSIDPYVQYGVGLQKIWGEKFTGFGQVMLRNGGRNGVSLQAGFRWALGDNNIKNNSKAEIRTNTEQQRKIKLSVK